LIADLERRALNTGEKRALDDFRSGEFLPGRGLLDMKSGVAAGIAVLEAFAADPERLGNLVLIATPDEERGSRGMRSLRDALPAIAAEFGLEIEACINLDATSDQGDGIEGRTSILGSALGARPGSVPEAIGQAIRSKFPSRAFGMNLVRLA